MKFILNSIRSLTKFECALLGGSITAIILSFVLTKNTDYLTLCASLIGAIMLIFVAKGNVIGQVLTVVFAAFYGIISFYFRYYGEMITYLGMTTPVAIVAIIAWIKNPYNGNKADVKINTLKAREYLFMLLLGLAVSVAFYFILKSLNTNNLIISTLSVFTSFLPCYLTVRRSEFYAIGYAANDIVLIILWTIACFENLNYLSMAICFTVFLANDIYGFTQWSKSKKRQAAPLP